MLRHERLPSPAVSSPKRYLYVLLAVVVASLCSDVIVAQSSSVSAPLRAVKDKIVERTTTNYIIIIDAGSSGSRVHVHPFIRKEPMPKIDPSKTLKITPGLSSYEHNPKEGGDSLIKLLDFAKENIPQEFWASTPIHLKATAGLRSIPLAAAEQVLVECRKVIRLYPFKFQDEWALIISGSQEGIFGWVSANYLEGFLGIPGKRTVGVIEMGGASMQITFVPDIVPPEVKNRVTPVTIGSQTYPVYTHSYLNYGLDAVQRLFHTTHHQHVTESGHPCYPKSYKHPQHTWSGTGNHEQCSSMMDGLFKKENCSVPQAMCTWNGIAQPPISTEKFYAIENYFYTSSFFGVHEHDNPWEHLEKKGKEYCSTHWDSISEQWAKESKDDLAKYCFSSIYLTKVLKRGFGLTSPNKHAHIRSKINGAKIDWALGAVLYELMLEAHHPIAPTTTASDDEEEGESISEESEMKPPSVPEVQASRSGIEDAKPLAPATPAVVPVDSVTDHSAHSAPLADEPKPTVAVVATPPAAPPVAVTEVAPSVATPPAPSVPIHAPETPAHLKNPVPVPSTVAEPIDFLEEERVKRVAEERRAGGTGSMHTLIDSFPATAPETATAVEVTGTAPDLFENELFLAAAGIMLSGVLLYAYVAAKKRNPFFILNYLGQRQASRRRPDIFLDELKFSV